MTTSPAQTSALGAPPFLAHDAAERSDEPGAAEPDAAVRAHFERSGPVVALSREVLKESRKLPVFLYEVAQPDPASAVPRRSVLVAKAYHRGDGAAAFAGMRQLWSAGFADDPQLRIPRSVAYLPESRLLLQEVAPGGSLYDHIDEPASALDHVRRTGRWLAKLHASGADAPLLDAERERDKLATFERELVVAAPHSAGRFRAAAARVGALEAAPAPVLVPTHGDFQPKNVHVAGSVVTVIDFDRYAAAPAARDLGHFLVQCLTMSFVRTGSFAAIAPWNDAFLEEYRAASPATALVGLDAAVVRSLLEVLYYKLVVRPVRDAWFLPAWLDECERHLEGAGSA